MSSVRYLAPSLTLLISGLLMGCVSDPPQRAPALSGMGGKGGLGVGSFGGGGTTRGGGGAVNSDDVVDGSLVVFDDDEFNAVAAYSQPASIHVLSENGDDFITFPYDGSSFGADSFELTEETWIVAEPTADRATMTTVSVHSSGNETFSIPLVSESVLQEIVGGLSLAQGLNETAAHLLVRLVDRNGDPVSGVEPTVSGGLTTLAFRDGSRWEDISEVTGPEGMFLSYNIATESLPGSTVKVILGGSLSEEFSARIVARAITVMTVVVSG